VNRSTLLLLGLAVSAVSALQAQTAAAPTNPMIAEFKRIYTQIKNNVTRGAEKMPEDAYGFKPVADSDMRTFGALMGHIADSTLGLCSAAHGARKAGTAGTMTAKADLVAALNAAFADCDAAWDTITDANATEAVGQRTKLGSLIYATMHANEEYGYMAVYLRLKGIVPPSSDNAGRSGKKK